MQARDVLATDSFFADVLTPAELDSLAGRAKIRQFESGAKLIREDDTGSSLFIVVSGDVVTVNQTGTYLVVYRGSFDNTTTNRTSVEMRLERDTGGGFTEVAGFRSFCYSRTNTASANSTGAQGIVDLTAGDQLRLVALINQGNGSILTLANGSGLTLVQL